MDRQPKPEPGSPSGFGSSNDTNFNEMTIRELVSVLLSSYRIDDYERVEEVLVSRDERLNAEIGTLREKVQMESLARLNAEMELKKREQFCERGKRLQESHEKLLKSLKVNGLGDIDVLRKKNSELECEVNDLRKMNVKKMEDCSNVIDELRKKNVELVCEVYKFKEMNEQWEKDSTDLAELRSRVRELEEDKYGLKIKNGELEEAVKKHLKAVAVAESLAVRFGELNGRVTKLEDDTKLLMGADGNGDGNNEGELLADTFQDKDEEDVADYEFGNDTAEPLRKNEDTRHSLGAAATARPMNKGSKDAQRASSAKGRLELGKGIEIVDLEDDDDDDDDDLSQGLQGKKDLSRITLKKEHPSSPVAIQQKSRFLTAELDMIKRKFSFSDDSSTSSSSSESDDKLPLSSTLLNPNRKKPRQTIQD